MYVILTEELMIQPLPKDYRIKPGTWGESKIRVQIMLTPTALERVDAIADKLRLTRAEIFERLARTQCLDPDLLQSITPDQQQEGLEM